MSVEAGWQEQTIASLFDSSRPGEWGTDGTRDAGTPVLRSTNFCDDGSIDYSDIAYRTVPENRLDARRISVGTILIEKAGGSATRPAGRVVYCDRAFGGTASNFVEVIQVGEALSSKYVFYLLYNNFHSGLVYKYQQQTTGIINFKLREYGTEVVSVPESRAEQSKIAEVLSTVDMAIAQTEALIAKQQRIKTGLMQDLLTRGIDEHGRLRSVATRIMVPLSELAKINPPRQRVSITGAAPVSFIPMSDVSESGRWTTRQARPYGQVVNGYTRFLDGDVLFAKITPCMENGKGCHAIGLVNGLGFASTEFHVLRAKDDSDARFIFQWTLDRNFRQKAAAKMTGSAGQQRVPKSFFDSFRVSHFKKPEQEKIAEVLTGADEMIEQGQSELTKLRHLKTALMQDLLTGKVRVTPLLQPAEAVTA